MITVIGQSRLYHPYEKGKSKFVGPIKVCHMVPSKVADHDKMFRTAPH